MGAWNSLVSTGESTGARLILRRNSPDRVGKKHNRCRGDHYKDYLGSMFQSFVTSFIHQSLASFIL